MAQLPAWTIAKTACAQKQKKKIQGEYQIPLEQVTITYSNNDSTHEEHEVKLARPTIQKRGHSVGFALEPGCSWEWAIVL